MNTDDNGREIQHSSLACPGRVCECGSTEFEMRNYSMLWHEGDIHCAICGKFIRTFDAG